MNLFIGRLIAWIFVSLLAVMLVMRLGLGKGKHRRFQDQATSQAGKRRFRPILLTSLTTFLGLLPLMLERSLQAQFLIPMAISLGFGVIFATTITLYLIPCLLMAAAHFKEVCLRTKDWYLKPCRDQV